MKEKLKIVLLAAAAAAAVSAAPAAHAGRLLAGDTALGEGRTRVDANTDASNIAYNTCRQRYPGQRYVNARWMGQGSYVPYFNGTWWNYVRRFQCVNYIEKRK